LKSDVTRAFSAAANRQDTPLPKHPDVPLDDFVDGAVVDPGCQGCASDLCELL
jgi:hypothetical protein